jgi:hypothetical protein
MPAGTGCFNENQNAWLEREGQVGQARTGQDRLWIWSCEETRTNNVGMNGACEQSLWRIPD